MPESRFKKAKLVPRPGEADEIVFMFNPNEMHFKREARWTYSNANRGSDLLPKVNFSGINPCRLTLPNLLFDTYERKTSVMPYIDRIEQGIRKSKKEGIERPPIYTFQWGETYYFDCVMEDLSYTLTMFLEDGTPVRALVNIVLLEVDPPTNPTA